MLHQTFRHRKAMQHLHHNYAPVLAHRTVHTVVPTIVAWGDKNLDPYLFKTSEQTSPVGRSLVFQEAEYRSEVVLFQSRFRFSPLKLCEPLYFWNCSVPAIKYAVMLGEKRCLYISRRKKEKSTNNQTAEYNKIDENTAVKDLQRRAISELKISCSIKECVTKGLRYILQVFICA